MKRINFTLNGNVVELCINAIKSYISISRNDLIIEPSAGNGSFIHDIKTLSNNCIFYDLEPENGEIIKQDFLELDYSSLQQKYNKIHIIGNPPFGRQSSLAIKFIKKCCRFSESISFILPKSFKKDSMRRYFSRHFHLIHEMDLPENSFIINEVEHDTPCVFQIWKYQSNLREKISKVLPQHFEFVRKEDMPDISFRRVGVNAGMISVDTINSSDQSHYFIKFLNDKTVDENVEQLKSIRFDFNNTVGPKSISKSELIKEFNRLI